MELTVKLLSVGTGTVNTRNGIMDKINIEFNHPEGELIKASGFANSTNSKWKAEDVVKISLTQNGKYWNYKVVDDVTESNADNSIETDNDVLKQLEFMTEVLISVHVQIKNTNRMLAKAGLMMENFFQKTPTEPDTHISRFKSNPAISKEVKEAIDKPEKPDKYDFLNDDDTLAW